MECSEEGCQRPTHCKGLCKPHYERQRLGIVSDLPIRRKGYCKNGHLIEGKKRHPSGACLECAKSKSRERCRKNRERLDEYKVSRGCSRCGYNKMGAALDLHHRDPTEKEFGVTAMVKLSWVSILKEIAKCDVICANCHREIHHARAE